MALEKTLRELKDLLSKLRDNLQMLQLNVREDAPTQGAVVLVDNLGNAVDDSLGSLHEALAALGEARKALLPSFRRDAIARALARCQEHFHAVELRFQSELVSYERLTDLTEFARSRRGEWPAWIKSVRQGLDQCRQPLDEISKVLLACWQELTERGGVSQEARLVDRPDPPCRGARAATGAT